MSRSHAALPPKLDQHNYVWQRLVPMEKLAAMLLKHLEEFWYHYCKHKGPLWAWS